MPARLRRIEKIVRNRDVVVLCLGPSIAELETQISRLDGRDICYVSINRFAVTETHILEKLGARLELVAETSASELAGYLEQVVSFLARADDNMPDHVAPNPLDVVGSRRVEARYDGKLLFYDMHDNLLPTPGSPLHFLPGNTLSVLLPLLQLARPARVFLFGADGHVPDSATKTHYRMGSREFTDGGAFDEVEARERLAQDTKQFNDICDLQMLALARLVRCPGGARFLLAPKTAATSRTRG